MNVVYLGDEDRWKKRAQIRKIDREISSRLTSARIASGLSRLALSKRIGMSTPQLAKYELGENRISAAKLKIIAEAMGYDVSNFYEGIIDSAIQAKPEEQRTTPLCQLVTKNFSRIKNGEVQSCVARLIKILSEG